MALAAPTRDSVYEADGQSVRLRTLAEKSDANVQKTIEYALAVAQDLDTQAAAIRAEVAAVAEAIRAEKANRNSPDFTGFPTVPTLSQGSNNKGIVNTEYTFTLAAGLQSQINTHTGQISSNTASISGLQTQITNQGSGYAPINSPTFTGTPRVPNTTAGSNNTIAANTAYVYAVENYLQNQINTHTGQISSNSGSIDGLQDQITYINDRLAGAGIA